MRVLTPKQSLLRGRKYVRSEETDIRKTWAKFGWKPTAPAVPYGSSPTYQLKGK